MSTDTQDSVVEVDVAGLRRLMEKHQASSREFDATPNSRLFTVMMNDRGNFQRAAEKAAFGFLTEITRLRAELAAEKAARELWELTAKKAARDRDHATECFAAAEAECATLKTQASNASSLLAAVQRDCLAERKARLAAEAERDALALTLSGDQP